MADYEPSQKEIRAKVGINLEVSVSDRKQLHIKRSVCWFVTSFDHYNEPARVCSSLILFQCVPATGSYLERKELDIAISIP